MSLMKQSNVQPGKVEIQEKKCPRCHRLCFKKNSYATQEAAEHAAWSHATNCPMLLLADDISEDSWQQSWQWDSWPAQHDQPDPSPPPPPTTPPSTTHGDNLHVRATAIDDLYMSLMQQSNVQQGKVEIQKTDCPRCQHRCFRKYRYDTQEAAGQAAWSHANKCAMVLEGYHDV